MKRAAYVVSLLLAGCTQQSAAKVYLPPLVGASGKADDGAAIVPVVTREVRPTFDGSVWYTYEGSTQLGTATVPDAGTTVTTFTAEIVVFDGPCGDDPTCLFKADAVGVWPGGVRLALYSRPAGGGLADWQPLRTDETMSPPPEAMCSPLPVEQRVQIMDHGTFVHFVDGGGADCGYLTTTGTPLAVDAQIGMMVYPSAGTDAYGYRVAIDRATPPAAPTPAQ